MEQLTWPHGSGGHVFSTISASDYGEHDLQLRRKNSSDRRLETFKPLFHRNFDVLHNHEHLYPQNSLQIDLDEQAAGYSFDHSKSRELSSLKFFNLKDKKQDYEEQYGLEQVLGKAQDFLGFSSKKEQQQEIVAGVKDMSADPGVNKTKFCFRSVPCTPSRHESHPFINTTPRSPSSRGHCFIVRTERRKNSCVTGSDRNEVYHLCHYCCDNLLATKSSANFAMLPDDILLRIMGSFSWPNLWSASRVCHAWCQALAPLREAMHFVHWGKKFKHGRGGINRNLDKALQSFLSGAKRGCAAAMVDAGLLMWEMGQKQEGVFWYKQAAELGDPAGQCNLGLAYLQDSSNAAEAVKWFQRAALAGHVRAQYSLALCLQQGKGVNCNVAKAARWYQRAAEGGSARAMYNLALCYRKGEGLAGDSHEARKWMKRAALAGHRKAQFEHGLTLFAENDGGLALVFLELATRAGETAATHLRDALIQQLSPKMRTHAITRADKWQAKMNARA